MARIEAVVRRRRRSSGEAERGPLVVGELEIRPDQFQAFVAGGSVDLTRREFELLTTLSESAGTVIERGEIYRRVWGYEMAHGDRSVDVFVRKLRSKIQRRSSGWAYIHTHFGIGYRFSRSRPSPGRRPPRTGAEHPPRTSRLSRRRRSIPPRRADLLPEFTTSSQVGHRVVTSGPGLGGTLVTPKRADR